MVPPIFATNAPDLGVCHPERLEVGFNCEARLWNYFEDGIADRCAEVLGHGRVLGGGHQEKIAHPVTDVVLYLFVHPVFIALGGV